MNLLCRLGIHHPEFELAYRPAITALTGWEWLKLRRCARCKRPIERKP